RNEECDDPSAALVRRVHQLTIRSCLTFLSENASGSPRPRRRKSAVTFWAAVRPRNTAPAPQLRPHTAPRRSAAREHPPFRLMPSTYQAVRAARVGPLRAGSRPAGDG